jgi:hypothetical protein
MSYGPVTVKDIDDAISIHLAKLRLANLARERKCPYCGFPNRVWMDSRYRCFSNFCTVISSIIGIKYAERGYNV